GLVKAMPLLDRLGAGEFFVLLDAVGHDELPWCYVSSHDRRPFSPVVPSVIASAAKQSRDTPGLWIASRRSQ
ncbi:MAG: hypothetical protein E7A86_20635, partial [Bradyrhizobium sp.]|nr:hypothetical protein [Bradyrhizobium sp.]